MPDQEPPRQPITGWQRALAVTATRLAYGISRRWLFLFNLVVAFYLGLSFLAPILMLGGMERPALLIYKIYSPACHQMAHRSWFLSGEQGFYPFRSTGIDVVPFEEAVKDEPAFQGLEPDVNFFSYTGALRAFNGDERLGYKGALCQRDVAIYLSLLIGGILFSLLRGRLRPLPWQLFLLLGIIPMLVDGGYQMASYLFNFLTPHETSPLLRTITGALMGFGLVWLTYPHIEEGMQETEADLRANLLRGGVISES